MRAAQTNGGVDSISCWSKKLRVPRRLVLTALTGCLGVPALPAFAHGNAGPVKPPIGIPDIDVVSSDGCRGRLHERLLGRITAIQLMFSKCKSICPIEAATFVRVQEALNGFPSESIQLLSLSLDPLNDTPDVLKAWLEGFGAGHRWTAVSPAAADLTRVRRFFDRASSVGEDHSTAMNLVNRAGQLVWRTSELPAPNEVVKVLNYLQGTSRAELP